MQATKDTFLKTLAMRLAGVNASRTVVVDGVARPAVLAMENEAPVAAGGELWESFLLSWGEAGEARSGAGLMQMECSIRYGTKGSEAMLRTDRGRVLTEMDAELLAICSQREAAKCDWTESPAVELGTEIFWTRPVLGMPEVADGALTRTAKVQVYFFAEAA